MTSYSIDTTSRWRRRCNSITFASSLVVDWIAPLLSIGSSVVVVRFIRTIKVIRFFYHHNSNIIFWLPFRKPSPLRGRVAIFAGYLIFKAPAMVISWSRRVYFYFRCCCYRSIVSWNSVCVSLRPTSVRWYWFFFVFNKKCMHLIRKSYFYVQSV